MCAAAVPAAAQDGIRQYRAAMTKIFLWKYHAFPIFRTNPIYSGSVVRVTDELIELQPSRCISYNPAPSQRYKRAQEYQDGMAISTAADLRVKGALLTERIADVEARAAMKVQASTAIKVSPLSSDRVPDVQALRTLKPDPACQVIPRILSGQPEGMFIAAEVLHGEVVYAVTLHLQSQLSAAARGPLLAVIARAFAIKETEIATSADQVSFAVASTAAPQTLAIVHPNMNIEELARITNYLLGKRGADLENAVEAALTAAEPSGFRKAVNSVRSILGSEIKSKEEWTRRFISGEKIFPVDALRNEPIDMRRVATYAAALELTSESPAPANR
jgi:hypothetical protein